MEIHSENFLAVQWFLEHQMGIWRTGVNGVESMDYGQIHAAMKLGKMKQASQCFRQLLCIERGSLQALAESRKTDK